MLVPSVRQPREGEVSSDAGGVITLAASSFFPRAF